MIHYFKHIYLTSRFFVIGAIIIVILALSFVLYWLYPVGWVIAGFLLFFTVVDGISLFNQKLEVIINRKLPNILSLGDNNTIKYSIRNNGPIELNLLIIDELPYQLQERDFQLAMRLKKGELRKVEYTVLPTTRGSYIFGNLLVFITSTLGLIRRKIVIEAEYKISVYPSIIQMKKYELKAHSLLSMFEGIKKHRRIGHSYEFEQIKEYVIGDDSRSVNWKASGRRGTLMVNHYEDERSQQVYSIIDKSRSMRMPFNNLTLLDYSINTSLVISNIILQKHDKAGLITFSDKIGTILPAEKSSQQLRKIIEALYNEQEHFLEAEYELLFHIVRNVIKQRSLLLLYTNFESFHAFERILPILRQINKLHLLLVIFFDNENVVQVSKNEARNLKDIYVQMSARKYLEEKRQIVTELSNHGIMSIKTLPGDLSMNTVNKYLELKSRGMI